MRPSYRPDLGLRLRALVVAALLALVPVSLATAQDSAQSQISITRAEQVKISNIDDWMIGIFTATDTIPTIVYNWDWQCVYTTTGSFRVEVTSANGGTRLHLEDGAGNSMNYWLYIYFRRGATYTMDSHTTPTATYTNLSGSTRLDCSDEALGSSNLWFAALVRPADFNPAPPGIYRDVVTLVVSPE